ncbi:hypothetical protein K439DRAFT_174346 [Ramaria rubella]|nr:hypothetical protein K439DRAFT_174346 [Ramaria rubella]
MWKVGASVSGKTAVNGRSMNHSIPGKGLVDRSVRRYCLCKLADPLIRFLGKRSPSSKPHTPQPHPAAPPDIVSHFQDFMRRLNSSTQSPFQHTATETTSHTSHSFVEFWEAPARLWAPARKVDEKEIEAVLSGGASLR